jgi:hypothetical protein
MPIGNPRRPRDIGSMKVWRERQLAQTAASSSLQSEDRRPGQQDRSSCQPAVPACEAHSDWSGYAG